MNIAGTRALVTGAAGGIGRACALMLAAHGADTVVIVDRDAAGLERVAADVRLAGATAVVEVVDLSQPAAVADLLHRGPGLDIVHNNAGVMSGPPDFPDTHLANMIAAISINLAAPIVATRVMVELMRRRGRGGLILNTASTAAFGALPPDPVYSATKAALVNFTQACKPLAERFGIRVMAICTGITDTNIVQRDAEWLKPALGALKIFTPEYVASVIAEIIADDSKAGEYVALHNEPAGAS